MAFAVVSGATCMCTMGTAPGQVNPTNQPTVRVAGIPVASTLDSAPMANVTACGMCTSLANPLVASATAAAMGVLTPQPCIPATTGAWMCPSIVRVAGNSVLTGDGRLTCAYGGSISIVNPGQATVKV